MYCHCFIQYILETFTLAALSAVYKHVCYIILWVCKYIHIHIIHILCIYTLYTVYSHCFTQYILESLTLYTLSLMLSTYYTFSMRCALCYQHIVPLIILHLLTPDEAYALSFTILRYIPIYTTRISIGFHHFLSFNYSPHRTYFSEYYAHIF
jgi:hypothetical protein